jgi:Tfp pilus assembly protein PilF
LAGFRAAAAKTERNAPTHGNIGLCLARLGRKAEALKELDRAIAIDPRYQPAMFNRLAVERMEEGKPMAVAGFERIEFSKDQLMRKRKGGSFFRRFSEMRGRMHERESESDDRT